jgi:recombination protein RecT
MGNKLIPEAQAREEMAEVIAQSKRRFTVQNKKVQMLEFSAEARFALEAVCNNKLLLKCDPDTLKDSMVHLACMGLSLNPAAQQAALIPRYNTKKGAYDCTASPMFRGLMKLATDTGLVTNIRAEVVFECEEDTFDVDLGSTPYLRHKPKMFAPPEDRHIDLLDDKANRLIGAYCIAHLRDSEHPHITMMDLSEIHSVARASDAFNPRQRKNQQQERKPSGPWVYWPQEMIKKAIIRRASKQWPLSDDSKYQRLLDAIDIDNRAEANEQRTEVRSEQVEADMGETLTEDHIARIKDLCSTQELETEVVYNNYGVNSLSKIKQKFFDEIEEKLLDRQRRYNEAKKADGRQADGSDSEGTAGEVPAEPQGEVRAGDSDGPPLGEDQ